VKHIQIHQMLASRCRCLYQACTTVSTISPDPNSLGSGDSHQVQLTLKRQRLGRSRLNRLAKWSWSVEWEANTPGIETRPGKGGIISASVRLPDEAVEARCWDALACALVAHQLGQERERYGYTPKEG
jgi:hypothetical protein